LHFAVWSRFTRWRKVRMQNEIANETQTEVDPYDAWCQEHGFVWEGVCTLWVHKLCKLFDESDTLAHEPLVTVDRFLSMFAQCAQQDHDRECYGEFIRNYCNANSIGHTALPLNEAM